MKISYKTRSLIYKSMGIALVGENGGVIDVRVGINRVQVEHNQSEIYMNSEHMVAGSEENKRQDFTINNVQGKELISTKFECRNLVLGILEVMWRWQK